MYDALKTKLIEREADFKKVEEALYDRNLQCDKLSDQLQLCESESELKMAEASREQQRLIEVSYERDKVNRHETKEREEDF